MNYATPLLILREKVPFMELSWRLLKFIIKPRIPHENLEKTDLQYVLWDYVLVASLFAAVTAISVLLKLKIPLSEQLAAINVIPLFLNVFYKCITASLSFYAIWLITLKLSDKNLIFKKSYILTLHYLRVLLIFAISIFSISLYVFHNFINYGRPPSSILNGNIPTALVEITIAIFLLFWCVVIPIKKYTSLKLNYFIITCLIVFSAIIPFYINTFLPGPIDEFVINYEKLSELSLKSPVTENLDKCQKDKLIEILKQKNTTKY